MKTAAAPQAIEYQPYDDRTQILWQIPGYPRSFTRYPSKGLIPRPLTLTERTGPVDLERRMEICNGDFSHAVEGGPRAMGQLISVSGRVVNEDGAPVAGTIIELWQANAAGKYIHELDEYDAPLDPHFTGQGRIITDSEGCYQFTSIKPGAYPVLQSDSWWRPPHIHFSIFGESFMTRYITQVFFPGEPLNETDLLLNGVRDEEARDRIVFKTSESPDPRRSLGFTLDFVLRGKRATPELP
jgi:protocatechuate 3,4-dioxygenase beta subunit